MSSISFFSNDAATTKIYTLSLHDALPIFIQGRGRALLLPDGRDRGAPGVRAGAPRGRAVPLPHERSEEHTSELQSRRDLVCRLLLEIKKINLQTLLTNFSI